MGASKPCSNCSIRRGTVDVMLPPSPRPAPTCETRPVRRAHASRAVAASPRRLRPGRRRGRPDIQPTIAPPRGWCGSSGTIVCEFRSDTTAHRRAQAVRPPVGATAMRDRDRTRPAPVRGRPRSVDPAHPVDGHLFNQGLGDELGVGVGLLVRLHDVAFRSFGGRQFEWMWSKSQSEYGIECRNGRAGSMAQQQPRVGRRRSTTPQHITDVALGLFADRGFSEVSVDDVAQAAGIARRSVFRYYASKNAIPWGDFDAHLQHLRDLLDHVDPDMPLGEALRDALLSFNTFDESETVRHRRRMRVILQTAELQAYSMTMYAGWRDVIAGFVARRTGAKTADLKPQTVAWMMLGAALSAYEHWLDDESVALPEAVGDAFDVVRAGLKELDR